MTPAEIFDKEAARLEELKEAKSCLVCNFFRTKECPRRRLGGNCHKFQYYLGREAK